MSYKPFQHAHAAATPATSATVATESRLLGSDVAVVADVAALHDLKALEYEERAAICEHDGRLPRKHAEQLAALHAAPLPDGVTEEQRAIVIDAAALFLDRQRRRNRVSG
jgi:hypothetical protein